MDYLVVIVFGILILLIIILITWNGILLVERINPSTCPKAAGDFGLQTKKTAVISNKCNSRPCIFTAISLDDAIDQCNGRSEICDSFIYSHSTSTMSIIDESFPLTSGTDDVFTRQVPRVVTSLV